MRTTLGMNGICVAPGSKGPKRKEPPASIAGGSTRKVRVFTPCLVVSEARINPMHGDLCVLQSLPGFATLARVPVRHGVAGGCARGRQNWEQAKHDSP